MGVFLDAMQAHEDLCKSATASRCKVNEAVKACIDGGASPVQADGKVSWVFLFDLYIFLLRHVPAEKALIISFADVPMHRAEFCRFINLFQVDGRINLNISSEPLSHDIARTAATVQVFREVDEEDCCSCFAFLWGGGAQAAVADEGYHIFD